MSTLSFSSESDIRNFLKDYAPYSVVDRGLEFLTSSQVQDFAKAGSKIVAEFTSDSGENFTVQIDLKSGKRIKATCTCCSQEDLEEFWCEHVVAALWNAWKLDFISESSGFVEEESSIRLNHKTSEEIADTLKTTARLEYERHAPEYYPEVKVELHLDSDRLGVKVHFDGQVQTAQIFEASHNRSSRELDNVLIQVLEDEGSWDDVENTWYINSSHSIEIVLGLLQEYKSVISAESEKQIQFCHDLLEAAITVEWQDTAAELVMSWVLPDGEKILKTSELLGTGPFWTALDDTIYKLSPTAAHIASIFPYSATVTLSRQQSGPILELLENNTVPNEVLEVLNPDKQPEAKIKQAKPQLELERINQDERFANTDIALKAKVDFNYPTPPKSKNIVYLPDREVEEGFIDELKSLGFEYDQTNDRYSVKGDAALDLIHKGEKSLSSKWTIDGLETLQQETKFSSLKLSLDIASGSAPLEKENKNYGIDWFDCKIALTQNNANVPLSLLFKNSTHTTDRWLKLDNGAWAMIPGGGLNQLQATLGMVSSNYKHANSITAKLSTAQAISLNKAEEDPNFAIRADKKLADLSEKLQSFTEIKSINPPALFDGKLRIYQKEGLSWLNFLNEFALDGILADEMGLGKTVQTLALLQSLKSTKDSKRKLKKPALVVAPTSVTTNWLYEAKRFTPRLKTLLLHGPKRKAFFEEIDDHDVVITSYALLRSDRYELEKHDFSYVILDEAQNIKNPLTATAKAAKAINSERRLALSGTPTENRPLELWSIFDFLMPGYLGSYDFFRNQIEKPIIDSGTGTEAASILNSKTRPFILRRIKADVEKQLPDKIESEMHVAMTESQKELYGQILEEVRPKVMDAVDRKGVRGASVSILAALLRLRQVCNHPNSIDGLKDLPGYESGKFELLKELLRESLASGRKILLFSQFREMLAIIRRWIEEEEISYLYLDGATRNRQQLVDQFNIDEKVKIFLISLKAGGTGLNLTAADTVVIYDPWWNPAVENQAIDRAHRIGQRKNVNVYRLVTEDSIEQKIMELKAKKSSIVDALINDNGLSSLSLSKGDLDSLFSPLA